MQPPQRIRTYSWKVGMGQSQYGGGGTRGREALVHGQHFPRMWLQSVHVSFILQSYLLRCMEIGTTSWDRSIQDMAAIVVMVGTGCRTGEVLVSKDYDDEMTLKWSDPEIGFQDGVPDMEHAVVKVRLRHQKSVKGHLNQWRDVNQISLAIEGMAHMDMSAIAMTYSMRSWQVKRTQEDICPAAVKNKDRKVKWPRPDDPFMHRWLDSNSSLSKPNYQTAMNTDGYLSRFKIICETASFGDQVLSPQPPARFGPRHEERSYQSPPPNPKDCQYNRSR